MSELMRLEAQRASIEWKDMRTMLNDWWAITDPTPMTPPRDIKKVVQRAVDAGWGLDECYRALAVTWAFTDRAFETALRRVKDESSSNIGRTGERILQLRKERNERNRTH